MPGANGFELLEQLDRVPLVIFTTAYDEYALKAFEVNALDYLLKPVAPERLSAALAKLSTVKQRPAVAGDQQIFVKDGERCWFVALRDIVLLESEGNYTRLYFGGQKPLVLRSLNYLEDRLDPALFFRASRKHILNLKFIEAIDAWETDVEHDEVGGVRRSDRKALLTRRSLDDSIAVRGKRDPNELAHPSFVLDEKDKGSRLGHRGSSAWRLRPPSVSPASSGSVNRNAAPPPARGSTHTRPPCALTIPRQMANPRPTPPPASRAR